MRYWPALVGLAVLAACSRVADEQAAEGEAAPAPAAAASVGASAAKARKVEISNELMEFDYSYPALAIPALKAILDADLEKQKAITEQGGRELHDAARQAGENRPSMVYSHSTDWKVVTELPGWLSLSADRWEFTGGAHGNPWTETLLWDKTANVRRTPLDLFASKAGFTAAIGKPFCDELDRQRTEKREAPVNRESGDWFDACIDPTNSTVILGSSDRKHFDRIGVLVDPYEAGPYVEGSYEVTLPVTQQVIAAVKPEYRKFFAVKR